MMMVAVMQVLHSSCFYPGDYGFIPQTLCADGDPIDVLVLSKFPLMPGTVAACRLVGVMDMEDEKGGDAKLIAVVASEPRTLSITDIDQVPLFHMSGERVITDIIHMSGERLLFLSRRVAA